MIFAKSWSTAGITGVHAQGTTWTQYSYVYVKGYVKDTACDNHRAEVRLIFVTGSVLGTSPRKETVSTAGKPCGTVKHFQFRSHLSNGWTRVRAKECKFRFGSFSNGCGKEVVIWKD